jgi:hypothetical protein
MARIQEVGATNDALSKDLSRSFQSAHINFLIGSGASHPAIPLAGEIERQVEALHDAGNLEEAALRICSLLRSVQEPTNRLVNRVPNAAETATLGAYQTFIRAVQTILTERRTTVLPRQATIFTTNYDIFIERAARSLGFAVCLFGTSLGELSGPSTECGFDHHVAQPDAFRS